MRIQLKITTAIASVSANHLGSAGFGFSGERAGSLTPASARGWVALMPTSLGGGSCWGITLTEQEFVHHVLQTQYTKCLQKADDCAGQIPKDGPLEGGLACGLLITKGS